MFTKCTVVALFAALAAAYHEPVGKPTGNAITSPLIEVVPAGKPYTIKWTPSTPNKVSLILLKGPSTNAVFNQVIVESIPNSGSFVWTPPTTLEGTPGPGGYGIQLIDDINGQYQYSTQFGIANEKAPNTPSKSDTSPAPKPTETGSGYAQASSSSSEAHSSSTSCTTTTTVFVQPPKPTGSGSAPHSVVQPTGPVTVPESLKTSATSASVVPSSTTPPQFQGSASNFQAGVGLVGAVAAFVALL